MPLPINHKRLAALDLGSNALRLLVADCAPDGIVPVLRAREVVRLGLGMKTCLTGAAKERARIALHTMVDSAKASGARVVLLLATHACRRAADGPAFVETMARELGLSQAQVLSPRQESALVALGVQSKLKGETRGVWVLDIGAGSTELAPVSQAGAAGVFLPFGALNLNEKFIRHNPPRVQELSRIRVYLRKHMPAWPKVGRLVASSGTAASLAALDMGLTTYEPERINNHIIKRPRLQALLAALCRLSFEERAALPGMDQGRADIIITGLLLLQEIMTNLRLSQLTTMDAGLLEGALLAFKNHCEEIFEYEPGSVGLNL